MSHGALEPWTKRPLDTPDPLTGSRHEWVAVGDRCPLRWRGYTGPLRLDATALAQACQTLLGVPCSQLQKTACAHVETAAIAGDAPRLFLHSTTPNIRAYEADLAAMSEGRIPLDLTTYTETRALYLARQGDLAFGRTAAWQLALTDATCDGHAIDDADHYYLSHALLQRACARGAGDPAIARIIGALRANPSCVVSTYSLEPEFLLLLTWLSRQVGCGRIRVDANDPNIASIWNRKRLLHPTVELACALETACKGADSRQILDLEAGASEACALLGQPLPVLPGYVIETQPEREAFVAELLCAGELLQRRHGLSRACLKPSEGGDGGRIVPGIPIADHTQIEALGRRAWAQGGHWVLEAHVDFLALDLGGERVLTTPSAHVQEGAQLDGLTLQFMRGTSWKGNVFVDASGWRELGLATESYARVVATMAKFHRALSHRGLCRVGIDFAIGHLTDTPTGPPVIAVQDINVKLTGAAFLREFMARHGQQAEQAATRVFCPQIGVTPRRLRERLNELAGSNSDHDLIAVVPGRWGMLASAGACPGDAANRVLALERELISEGLALAPTNPPS